MAGLPVKCNHRNGEETILILLFIYIENIEQSLAPLFSVDQKLMEHNCTEQCNTFKNHGKDVASAQLFYWSVGQVGGLFHFLFSNQAL